jgi:carbonic anhydrase
VSSPRLAPDDAIKKLIEGNRRYVSGKMIHPNRDEMRRKELASGQSPFAVIIGCSDSRVPPELIFDQGFGDLFIVRVAGGCIDPVVTSSVEYVVEHLGASVVVVLGHARCAAMSIAATTKNPQGYVKVLVDALKPAVDEGRKKPGDLVYNSIMANVQMTVDKFKESEHAMGRFVKEGKVRIVGAFYDIDTGEVSFFD